MIEIISGSNRAGNNTIKIARIIEALYKDLGVEVQIIDLRDMPMELFSPDAYANKPAGFAPFQERILNADGLHVVAPEYNGSFPGALKLFIDMLKFPESFEHRPVAYTGLGAGLWGNIRGIEQLQLVFNYRNAFNLPHRVWVTGVGKKLSVDGTSLNDDMTNMLMKQQTSEFVEFVEKLKGKAAKSIAK